MKKLVDEILYKYFEYDKHKKKKPSILEIIKNDKCCRELNNIYLCKNNYQPKEHLKNNPFIFAFDIETSTTKNDKENRFNEIDEERSTKKKTTYKECTFMHQFTVSALETKTKKLYHVYCGRYIEELFNIFENLMCLPYETVIYSHNYSGYESHLLKQYNFIEENTIDLLAYSPSRIICQWLGSDEYIGTLKICDSFLITNKSIKKLGNELNFPKLDYNYGDFKLPTDKLTDEEIEYCYRDNDISLLAIYEKAKLYPWLFSKGSLNSRKIPITSTGFIRKELKYNKKINRNDEYKEWCALCKDLYITEPQLYLCVVNAFNGGYVHANPYYVGKPLKNVTSVDIRSDYPSQLLNRQFPHTKWEQVERTEFKTIEKELKEKIKNWRDLIGVSSILQNHYVGTFIIKGLHFKTFQNKNVFPIISSCKTNSKTTDYDIYDKSTVFDNGKILKSDIIVLSLTEVELLSIMLTYNYKSIECVDLYRCRSNLIHPLVKNAILYFGEQKSEYKYLLHELEKNYDCNIECFNIPKEQAKAIEHSEDRINTTKQYLQNAKAHLNGIYGQQVQKQTQLKYQLRNGELIPMNIELEKQLEVSDYDINHSYSIGIYVTSWARLQLVLGFYTIVSNGGTFIYGDTDSLKYIDNGNKENIEQGFNYFNECIANMNDENIFNFGIYEIETVEGQVYTYNNFCTLGAKKYIATEYNSKTHNYDISITIAGLPKSCKTIWQQYYDKYNHNFNKLVNNYFHHNIIIDKSLTQKLGHSDLYKHIDMSDYYIMDNKLPVYSMLNLIEIPFDMNRCVDETTPTDYYCYVLKKCFNNKQNKRRVIIK